MYTWGSDSGQNTVVFLFHGAGECALTWSLVGEELARKSNYFVVAYDMRGHGLFQNDQQGSNLDVI